MRILRITSLLSTLLTSLLTSTAIGQGIVNGDFESGNTGFRTTYPYVPSGVSPEPLYTVASTTVGWHPLLANCGDHTTGTGQMMIVNGSPLGATDVVWAQSVAVQPQTAYTFSFWAASEFPSNPAHLRVIVEGDQHVRGLQLSSTTCDWERIAVDFWSGASASVSILIVSETTLLLGNDFALDDLSLVAAPGQHYCGPAVPNSSGRSAVCVFGGSVAAADRDVRLTALHLPANVPGVFLLSRTQAFVPGYSGAIGALCLGAPFGVLAGQVTSSGLVGAISIDVDTTSLPPPLAPAIQPGDTWNFQAWYRDANPGPTSNFTDAVSVMFI